MLLKLSLPEAAKPGMRAKPVEEQWKFVEMYAASGGAGGFEAADSAALKSVADAPARPPLAALRAVRTGIRTGAAAWLTGFYGAGGPRAVASVLWCFSERCAARAASELATALALEAAGCAKALVNHPSGLDHVCREGADLVRACAAAALACYDHVLAAPAAPPLLEALAVVAHFHAEVGRPLVLDAVRGASKDGSLAALAAVVAPRGSGPAAPSRPTRRAVRAGAMALANELVCGEADADERGALREEVSAAFDASTDDAAADGDHADASEADARGAALGARSGGLVAAPRARGAAGGATLPPGGATDFALEGAALRWGRADASEPAKRRSLVSFGAKAKRGGGAAGSLDLALVADVCPRSGHPDLGSPSAPRFGLEVVVAGGGVAALAADTPRERDAWYAALVVAADRAALKAADPGARSALRAALAPYEASAPRVVAAQAAAFRHMAREDAAAGGDGGGVEAVLDALRKRAAVPRLRAKVEVLGRAALSAIHGGAAAAAWRDAVDALCDGDVPENLRDLDLESFDEGPAAPAAPAAPAPATDVASALSAAAALPPLPAAVPAAPGPADALAKYRKMLRMHLPRGAVEQKMRAEGVDPALLDGDAPEAAAAVAVAGAPAVVAVKDDPTYARFFKMLAMRMPRGAVEQKLAAEGLDPAVLDLDPSKPAPRTRPKKPAPAAPPPAKSYGEKPPVPLRPWHWTALRGDAAAATRWSRAPPSVPFPAEDLHRALAARTSKPGGAVVASFVRTATTKPAARASFVDPRTAQNVGIALRKMRRPPEELAKLVLRGDACPESLLDLLASAAPTAEMRGLALAHRASGAGDDDLDDVERFLVAASLVPAFDARLEALDLRVRFGAAARDLEARLSSVEAACTACVESASLWAALALLRDVGNVVNGGTPRGGAVGFRLDALSRLEATKAADDGRPFLCRVVAWLDAHDGRLLPSLGRLRVAADRAARSARALRADAGALRARVARGEALLKAEAEAAKRGDAPDRAAFVAALLPVVQGARRAVDGLAARERGPTAAAAAALAAAFGAPPDASSPELILGDELVPFLSALRDAKADVDAARAAESAAARKAARARDDGRAHVKPARAPPPAPDEGDDLVAAYRQVQGDADATIARFVLMREASQSYARMPTPRALTTEDPRAALLRKKSSQAHSFKL